MIATDQKQHVAHLGGWRGDHLWLFDGSVWRDLGTLGWDERTRITPQRRLALASTDPSIVLVLEPQSGPVFGEQLRVRHVNAAGEEVRREEGADPESEHARALAFRLDGVGGVQRFGIDLRTGRPTRHAGPLSYRFRGAAKPVAGSPARTDGSAHWYPIRREGMVIHDDARADAVGYPGSPAPGSSRPDGGVGVAKNGRPQWFDAAASGDGGDAAWHTIPQADRTPIPFPRIFDPARPPQGQLWTARERGDADQERVVLWPDGAVTHFRFDRARSRVVDVREARLPPGRYSDIVTLAAGVFAVRVSAEAAPELIAVA